MQESTEPALLAAPKKETTMANKLNLEMGVIFDEIQIEEVIAPLLEANLIRLVECWDPGRPQHEECIVNQGRPTGAASSIRRLVTLEVQFLRNKATN
jgi:hypothetical protein